MERKRSSPIRSVNPVSIFPERSAGWPVEMADILGGLTDREDLARLFEKNVDLATIVRLMGRRVPREAIRSLLESSDPRSEVRRLLD